jgi:hypothetical protein
MKYTKSFFRIAALAALAIALPATAQQASLTTLVLVGDSEGAGYADNCLAKHSQIDSFGAIIARQAGVDFQQPLLDEPGIGGCLVLTSLAPSFTTKASVLKPLNFTLPRPYNNLAIGGCAMGDLTKATTAANARPGTCAQTIDLVLRNGPPVNLNLGSPVDQALALNPTFVIVEMVGNDLLGAVLTGDIRDGVTITPVAQYTIDLNSAITKLKTKVLNGLIFTTADVTNIPFATTIPPFLTSGGQLVLVGGQPVPLLGPKGCAAGVPACPMPANTLVTLNAAGYLPSGFGIPCAVFNALGVPAGAPQRANCDKPLPAAPLGPSNPGVLIYASDVTLLRQRAADYNTAIQATATANGYTVFDTNAFLTSLKTGRDYGGITISAAFLTGGAISYDGFHLTSIGQAILADEVIKQLNRTYGMNTPEPDISQILFKGNSTGGIPALTFLGPEDLQRAMEEIFTPEFRESLFNMMPPPTALKLGDVPVGDGGTIQRGAPEPGDTLRDRR